MSPATGQTRALSLSEQGKPLGTRLDDGAVVVSEKVAHAVQVGLRELNRRERRAQRRGRDPWRAR